jgi:uncharacterized protein (TIGR02421 family)
MERLIAPALELHLPALKPSSHAMVDLHQPGDVPISDLAVVARLSERILRARAPLVVLQSLAWGKDVEAEFHARKGQELPRVNIDTYRGRPLRFKPQHKRAEFADILADIQQHLGQSDPLPQLLERVCLEYIRLTELLEHRGTHSFYRISRELYGTTTTQAGQDYAHRADRLFAQLAERLPSDTDALSPGLTAAEAMRDLAERLSQYFGASLPVQVRLCERIVANAAAGDEAIKLRADATFSVADLRLLAVHEGWVHLGTSYNGQLQPFCRFLSKPTPSATRTQEGLAVLMELLAGVSSRQRVRRLWLRLRCVTMAEQGADFLQVYRACLEETDDPATSYTLAERIFRGSLPARTGPFTKDLCYSEGLIRLCDGLVRLTLTEPELLWSGKVALEDLPLLGMLRAAGVIEPPRVWPAVFRDPTQLRQQLLALTGELGGAALDAGAER